MNHYLRYLAPLGRFLLVFIFIFSGINKVRHYADTQGFMDSMGVPGMMLPLVIILEVLGGLAILVGWQARWVALAMAGFALLSAFIFHPFGDAAQQNDFMKNLAIAGGFLMIAGHGPGALSLDRVKYNYPKDL